MSGTDAVGDPLADEIERALAVDPSPDFVRRVRARVAVDPRPGMRRRWTLVAGALAASVGLVLVAAWAGRVGRAPTALPSPDARRLAGGGSPGAEPATGAWRPSPPAGTSPGRAARPGMAPPRPIPAPGAAAGSGVTDGPDRRLETPEAFEATPLTLDAAMGRIVIQPIEIQPLPALALLRGERPW